ncbi:exonuclease SbcCD subunit D [Clostridium sp. SHJSY1]|uniref:exonuclease SbcCD subunit D n=1 Tax=Clostridium sp. SHJSY1 TaxID=2942483 RepID=UPI00287682D9|nr:exonuclease SbcCD subunit D [Clostridium sp. SHJSY1]MDS0528140.1 exonuclease SbcCD subunit D [Clostridium sp. SHJSY1]
MKIFHTGDWHIGKIVNEFSMIEDQRYVLNKLIELIEVEKPDVLIIAGDIYDRSIPPVEAVELLNETIKKILIDNGVKIIAISGNHDSGERLNFGSNILEKEGLFISGILEDDIKNVKFNDNGQEVNFYLIPYADPAVVRKKYNNLNIKNHNDAMNAIISTIEAEINNDAVNIIVAHGYVTAKRTEAMEDEEEDKYKVAEIQTSDSERPLSIGGTDLIDGEIFKNFDYVALGHLHGRQKVGNDFIRYSGSLLKYSFSEVSHKKGVTIIEIYENKEINIRLLEINPLRDMRIIKGFIEQLICAAKEEENDREDYIQAILTDEGELLDPIGKLRSVYPNIMLLRREEKKNLIESNTAASEGYRNKSELDLFKEYYNNLGSGEFTIEKENIIEDIIKEILRKVED